LLSYHILVIAQVDGLIFKSPITVRCFAQARHKTAEAHCEAPCSNITRFLIEPPTAGLALSMC
jgi:hypothetical protein